MEETKICTKCGQEKKLEDFYKDKFSKDGYRFQCIKCEKEYGRFRTLKLRVLRILRKLKDNKENKNIKSKICTKCKEEKLFEDFYKSKYTKTGYKSHCKICCEEYERSVRLKNNEEKESKEVNIKLKVCTKCKKEKTFEEFNKSKNGKYGFYSRCKLCRKIEKREYYLKNRQKINRKTKEYSIKNKEKMDVWSREYRIKNKKAASKRSSDYYYLNIDKVKELSKIYKNKPAKYKSYFKKLTVEESPIEGTNGELLVKCTNSKCRKYFSPTNDSTRARVSSILGKRSGDSRLYCCDKCKSECDIYHAVNLPKSRRKESQKTRCQQGTNKKALLQNQIDDFGNNFCEKCGKVLDKKYLIIHHNIMVSIDRRESDNMAHQIIVCKDCHSHNSCF